MNASRTRDDLGWYPPHVTLFNGCLILDARSLRWPSEPGRGIPRSFATERSRSPETVRVLHLRLVPKFSLGSS